MPRGGRRKGAGRPKGKITPATKVIRVKEEYSNFITEGGLEKLLAAISDWQQQSKDSSPTSPRWEKARVILKELNEILEEYV